MIITSRKNQKIQLLRSLMRDRAAREENKIFTLEGKKLLAEALSCGYIPITVAVTEKAKNKNSEILNKLSSDVEILIINEELSGYIADTVSPQGLFFTLPLLDKILKSDKICSIIKNCRYIMLDGLQDLGNVGTIIRTADAFDMDGLILSPDACDIHSPKLVRSAMGSLFRLPVYRLDLKNAVSELKKSGVFIYAAMLDKKAKKLNDVEFKEKSCIIIGNEGAGINVQLSELSDEKIYIPIKNAESLNAAAAASIIIYKAGLK